MDPNTDLTLNLDDEDGLLEVDMPRHDDELEARDLEELDRYDEQILAGLVSP